MKKILSLIFVVFMMATLVGCNVDNVPGVTNTARVVPPVVTGAPIYPPAVLPTVP